MKYTLLQSRDGHTWEYVNDGYWNEIWSQHQGLKAAHPNMTYHIVS